MYPDAGMTGSLERPDPPENPLARDRRIVIATITVIVVLGLAGVTWYVDHRITDPAVLALWWIGNATLLFCGYAFLKARRSRPLEMATGRIVAIVPAHEQDTADLHACIWSILNQRGGVVVEEVHVVDDGSLHRPVEPFSHPRVRWHRTKNGGRHAAQVYVLDRLEPDHWDFVLIVNGGCVLAEHAMEHQLRVLSRPRVTATTGMVVVRNARQNLLTQITDLNIGTSWAMASATRSPAGALKMISGTPAVYRADLLFQQGRRGAAGDDRRPARYAALEGEVAGVRESIAWTRAPADAKTACRQRLRWSTSWWCMILPVLTGPDRLPGMARRLFVLVHLLVGPLMIGYVFVALAVSAWRGTLRWPVIILYASLYLLVRYAATGLYLIDRPETSGRRKLWTWLLLTPAEAICNLMFVVPVRYVALLRLRWPGRPAARDHGAGSFAAARDHGAGPFTTSTAEPGTVYYSGYLPTGQQS